MGRKTGIRWQQMAWALMVLCCSLLSVAPPLWADGVVEYRAGNLSGPPAAPTGPSPETGRWQDPDGTHYRSAPPPESWDTPWRREREREERSWNMLDNMILDVSPYRSLPQPRRPKPSAQPQ